MKYQRLTRVTMLFCLLAASAFLPSAVNSSSPGPQRAAPATGAASAVASPVAQTALGKLQGTSWAQIITQVSRQTGNFAFVRAEAGGVLAEADKSASPQARALAFLAEHGGLIGMNDLERAAAPSGNPPPASSNLQVATTQTDSIGMTHVKFDQFYQGLPVFGAQVVVHMNGEGITAVNGDYVPNVSLSTIPSVTENIATQTALVSARKYAAGEQLKVSKTEMAVYPMGLLEGSPVRSVLAYGVEISGNGPQEQVWIDAQSGAVLNRIPLRHTALNRIVYTPRYDPASPDMFVVHRENDVPPPPPPNVLTPTSNLFHYAGDVYRFFFSAFGRDSYDNKGITMRSVYLVNELCPNAYWNGQATNYCPEVDGDDVVAHEWGHAYTQFTHNLIYSYQSGALNESYSDIFGETVDLHNGFDAEGGSNNAQPRPAGQRWQIGEDTQGINQPALGILRNMWDPTEYGNPDKVTSPLYHCDSSDGGGVHTNSGPPNHAFAMLVDGKTFNGHTVTGIGFTKAIHIYFRAMTTYQTRTTNFPRHDQALKASCQDLLAAGPLPGFSTGPLGVTVPGATISQADCNQLATAMLAVEMSSPPPCNFAPLLNAAPAPLCDGSSDIFSEDWESGEDGWTKTSVGLTPDWEDSSKANTRTFKVKGALPEGRTGSAAYARNAPIGEEGGGTCTPGGDYSGQYTVDSPEITIPAGADGVQLRFDHYIATEVTFDGGQVEISRNGGAYELVPQDQYLYNPPNAPFDAAPPVGSNTNPNAGEFAWNGTNTGEQGGSWGTTVADLAGMGVVPGDKIKIRFTFSQDGCNGVDGWYVDNIRVYNCPVLGAPVLSIGAGYENPDTNGSYTLTWTRPPGASGPDTLEESTTSCLPLIDDNAEGGIAKWNVTTEGAFSGTNWSPTNGEKPQHDSTTFRARALENTVNASAILTYKDPLAIPAAGTTKLTFLDWNMNESDDGVAVEVSENGTTWAPVYTNQRSDLVPFSAELFASEPLFEREVDLTSYKGKTIHLRFRHFVGPENKPGSTPHGWYIDDIKLQNENWTAVGTTSGTSFDVTGRGSGTYCYRVRSTFTFGNVTAQGPFSNIVSVVVAPGVLPAPARLQNISTRGRVLTGDGVMIGGFIITGNTPKRLIARAMGPSLSSGGAPIEGRMTDPTLELHGENGFITSNDNWKDSQRADIEATGIPPGDDRESAMTGSLNPGAYTLVLRGKNDEIGIAIVELYDLDSAAASTLANLSTRGFVQTGDNVLIGGIIAGPDTRSSTSILIRGLGPSVPVGPNLANPTLQFVDGNGATVDENDNWRESQEAEIAATGIPPQNEFEAAIFVPTLAPGRYTAILRGANNTVGNGLVEIYNLR